MPAPERIRTLAQHAEALGYDSLWCTDHIAFHNPILEGIVALAAIAGWTHRITLGTGILLLPLRHPSLVAKQVASLDYLSEGRVVFGIGVGGEGAKDFEAVQVPIAERGARTNEGIDVLRCLWSNRPASFEGRFFTFTDVVIEPPPVQPGGPPIWVGGRSAAALRRAGRRGDGWLALLVSPERFRKDIAEVRAHAERAGRDPGAIASALMIPIHLDSDGDRARQRMQRDLSKRYRQSTDQDRIARYTLAGTATEAVDRLRAYVEAGARHFVFMLVGPAAGVLEQCERGYREVVLPLREPSSVD